MPTETKPESYIARLQRENKSLRFALAKLMRDAAQAPESRLEKLRKSPTPGGEDQYDIGYRTAVEEMRRLLDATISTSRTSVEGIELPSLAEIAEEEAGPVLYEKRTGYDETTDTLLYAPVRSRWNDFEIGDIVVSGPARVTHPLRGSVVKKGRSGGRNASVAFIAAQWTPSLHDIVEYYAGEWSLESETDGLRLVKRPKR